MIDYLFSFPDEATAQADPVVGQYYRTPSTDDAGGWRADCSFPCQVFDNTDPTAPVALPGFFLWLALTFANDAMKASSALVLAADRDLAAQGNPNFILQRGPLAPADLSTVTVSPVIAGSRYPFG